MPLSQHAPHPMCSSPFTHNSCEFVSIRPILRGSAHPGRWVHRHRCRPWLSKTPTQIGSTQAGGTHKESRPWNLVTRRYMSLAIEADNARGALENVSTRPGLRRGEDALPFNLQWHYLEYNDSFKITNQDNKSIYVYLYPRHCPLP